jgi:hypothetical protein
MLFCILAPNDFGYSVYSVWYAVYQKKNDRQYNGHKKNDRYKQDSQNRWEQEYQTA